MKQIFVVLWMLAIFIASSWALFAPGFFFIHDYVHGARIAEMSQALLDGHFPVRWSDDFAYGYGMPLFEFYAPLPFYVGSLFYLLGVSLITSVKIVFLISNLGTLLGAYYLGKSLYGRMGGLLTTAAITLAPYRAVNLFVRGAVSETWGLMAAVWVLYFTVLVVQGKPKAWLGLSVSLTALFLSHNLMTIIFLPFAVALTLLLYVIHYLRNNNLQLRKTWGFVAGKIVLSYLTALAVSSFYLFPAFLEKDFTKINETIVGGYFDFHLHFLYLRQLIIPFWSYGGSEWGPQDKMSFFLGAAQLIVLFLALLLFIKQLFFQSVGKAALITQQRLILLVGLLSLLLISVLLTTQKTLGLWDSISLLSFIQFPWRLLAVTAILIGLIAPFSLLLIKNKIRQWLFGWLMLMLFIPNSYYFRPERWLDDVSSLYYNDRERIRQEMSSVLPDYIPVSLSNELQRSGLSEPYECTSGCKTVDLVVDRTHEKLFNLTISEPTVFITNMSDYPGMEMEINGTKTDYINAQGRIAAELKPGEYQIGVRYGSSIIRQIADTTSLLASIFFGGATMYYIQKERQHA